MKLHLHECRYEHKNMNEYEEKKPQYGNTQPTSSPINDDNAESCRAPPNKVLHPSM